MARFISISLAAAVMCNMFVFAQKYAPVPMRMFVQESVLAVTPFISDDLPETSSEGQIASVTMHVYNSTNSNYLTLEVLGASKVMAFQLINSQGKEMYSGAILGTQLVETESWPAGTYYFLCGTKRETIDLIK